MRGEILYYTDNKLEGTDLLEKCRKTVRQAGLPVVSVSLKRKIDLGRNLVLNAQRAHSTLFTQILMGLLVSDADYIFFAEHDILYHDTYWSFVPPRNDTYYYNRNAYKYRLSDRKVITYDTGWLSQLCANRELLIRHYTYRMRLLADGHRAFGFEPGTGQSKNIDNVPFERYDSEFPNIDIRHGGNFTGVGRMDPSEFMDKSNCQNFREISVEDVEGWDADFLLSL